MRLRTGVSKRAFKTPRTDPCRYQISIAKDYFYNQKYQTVEIIKLNGSIELAPIVGLSEVIVDIVETGSTLRENGLVVLEEVCDLSARMVVNQVSMKTENERITKIIKDFQGLLKEKERADK